MAFLADVLACPKVVVCVQFAIVAELTIFLGGGVRALGGEADGRLARQAVFREEVEALELLDGGSLMRLLLQY